jgi:hypothetical protein
MATLGKTTIGGINSSLSQNFQWAAGPYTVSENGTITQISWYVANTSTSFKLGVFADNGGTPGALIAFTDTIADGTGWPVSNEYITGGRITVAYAPINPQ